MSEKLLKHWLDNLIYIWVTKNPDRVVELVADVFRWHDAPFDPVITSKEALVKEWKAVLDHDDVQATYEIIALQDTVGIVHWHASFTRLPTKEKTELDGIYKVELNNDGKCTEFHQWYNAN